MDFVCVDVVGWVSVHAYMLCVTTPPLFQQHSDTPLYWAARHGHLDMAQYLVTRGATVGLQDKVCVRV